MTDPIQAAIDAAEAVRLPAYVYGRETAANVRANPDKEAR